MLKKATKLFGIRSFSTAKQDFMLDAISPIDGRYYNSVQGLEKYFSEHALIKYRTRIEIEWLKHIIKEGIVTNKDKKVQLSSDQMAFLDDVHKKFSIEDARRVKEIEKTTNHDVKAVEYLVKEKLTQNPSLDFLKEFVHFSCTSEDINNLSYSLLMNDANQEFLCKRIGEIVNTLGDLAEQNANVAMLGRTHGQVATPTTVGKEFANFSYRVNKQYQLLKNLKFSAKLNGAVGNFNAHIFAYPEYDWPKISREFIEGLGMEFNPYTTQIEPHDSLANFHQYLALINTILIGFSRDMWMYISIGYFKQKMKKGEIGSSTMPHKVNPIDFENCEGNLGLAISLSQHFANKLPISRFQRDLSDSTVMRNNGVAIAYSEIGYRSLQKGLGKIEVNKEVIAHDLDSHWEVLAEPIQTVMRKYGIENPYEKLKELTRGKTIDKESLQKFVNGLDLPESEKKRMLELRPETYLGNAPEMSLVKKKYLK